jgi:hypothetical protein
MTTADDDTTPDAPRLGDGGLTPLSEASGLCGGPGQISCSEANELIQSSLDRATDADTGTKVAEHLGDCPPCEHEFVVYQRIIGALERCRPSLPDDTKGRLEKFCTDLCNGEVPADQLLDADRLPD